MSATKELFELENDEDDLPRLNDVEGVGTPASGERPGVSPPTTVVFTVGELSTYAAAVVVLVIAAYLIGAYVGRDRPQPSPIEPTMSVVPAGESLLPDAVGRARQEPVQEPLPNDPPRPAPEEAPSPPSEAVSNPKYTLEVMRFRVEDRAVALIHLQRLQKLGYIPAFPMSNDGEVGVCVGKFATRQDKTGLRWRDEIRNIHSAYRYCDFVRLR